MENNCTKFIVYMTVNLENNKIYIGVHKTNCDSFDYYYGNGIYSNMPSTFKHPKTHFGYAIKKFGFNKFRRYTIASFDTEEEALLLESCLVNQRFVNRLDTYNEVPGGGSSLKFEIPVYQFDLDGNLIKKFDSLKIASESIGAKTSSALIAAYKTKKSYLNYFWSLEDKIDITQYRLSTFGKNVYKFDLNANLINIFNGLSSAALDADVSSEQIKNAIYKQTTLNKYYYSYNSILKLKLDLNRVIFRYDVKGNYIDSDTIGNYAKKFNLQPLKLHKVSNAGLCLFKNQWNIINPIKMNDLSSRIENGSKKKVGQYTIDGKLIKIFNSVKECKKEFTNVSRCLSGKVTTAKGFVFKYILDN